MLKVDRKRVAVRCIAWLGLLGGSRTGETQLEGLRNLCLNVARSIRPLRGNMQDWNARCGQSGIEECIAVSAPVCLVAFVVQLDDTDDAQGARIAQHEINVLAGDTVEGGLALLRRKAGLWLYYVGEANLAEDDVTISGQLREKAEKGALGRAEQGLDAHERISPRATSAEKSANN